MVVVAGVEAEEVIVIVVVTVVAIEVVVVVAAVVVLVDHGMLVFGIRSICRNNSINIVTSSTRCHHCCVFEALVSLSPALSDVSAILHAILHLATVTKILPL